MLAVSVFDTMVYFFFLSRDKENQNNIYFCKKTQNEYICVLETVIFK